MGVRRKLWYHRGEATYQTHGVGDMKDTVLWKRISYYRNRNRVLMWKFL